MSQKNQHFKLAHKKVTRIHLGDKEQEQLYIQYRVTYYSPRYS